MAISVFWQLRELFHKAMDVIPNYSTALHYNLVVHTEHRYTQSIGIDHNENHLVT